MFRQFVSVVSWKYRITVHQFILTAFLQYLMKMYYENFIGAVRVWRVRLTIPYNIIELIKFSIFVFVVFIAGAGIIVLVKWSFSKDSALKWAKSKKLQQRTSLDSPTRSLAPMPDLIPLSGVWQPVRGTVHDFYVYSAYVEFRMQIAVRVIAATVTYEPDIVYCRLWLPTNKSITLQARVQAIRETSHLNYSASFVLCMLREEELKRWQIIGASLAIVTKPEMDKRPASNLLIITDAGLLNSFSGRINVCVKPFFHANYRKEWMLEWIEMNRHLGVEHFYIYNTGLSKLLSHYQQQALITLLPCELPIKLKESRILGQVAALNDCLYRSALKTDWLLFLDIDELVLPRRENTLTGLFSTMISKYKPHQIPSALIFKTADFYTAWEDDPESPGPLLTSRKTRRLREVYPYYNHSKYAVQPNKVIEIGSHFVWEFAFGATNAVGVPEHLALLHHYRAKCSSENCLNLTSTIDRTAHRWSELVLKRVKENENRSIL